MSLERTVRCRKPGVMPLLVWPAQKYMPESLSVVDGILRAEGLFRLVYW